MLPNGTDLGCIYDWVRIDEESEGTNRTLLDRTCGAVIPSRILSKPGSTVSVYFSTDQSNTDRGFELDWAELKNPDPTAAPTPATIAQPGSTFCVGYEADADCCTLENPCDYSQGDCDFDYECKDNLR